MRENTTDADSKVRIAVIVNDLTYIKEKLNEIDAKVSENYLTKTEFEPIKAIVYGVVSLILLAVVGTLVTVVMSQGQSKNIVQSTSVQEENTPQ